jgi:hypothetical protein
MHEKNTLEIFCGIDFNLMNAGDGDFREKCLEYWLNHNCNHTYNYRWSGPDTFGIEFECKDDMINARKLITYGIPRVPDK